MSNNLPHPDLQPVSVLCAVVTVSDTRSPSQDLSGQKIQTLLSAAGHQVVAYEVVPDEPTVIQSLLYRFSEGRAQVIILSGGTGIAPRDTTYDVLLTILDKELPGFGEIFRWLSYPEIGSRAITSRATAGIYHGRVVFSLPGSMNAVTLAMEKLILPELVHLTRLLES
jgi:molybdopterin adenylyltransferase